MSVITLPPEFRPSSVALRMAVSQRVSASPFGGSEEAVDLLNDRWLMSCELPARRMANGAWLEAFIGALRGQSNTVALHHFARPAPLGTIRGNLTLSAAAAQGASSLAVTGCQTAYSTVKAGDMFSVGGLLVQAASDAVSGGVNLLTYSGQIGGLNWTDESYSGTKTMNFGVSPDGSTTTTKYVSTGGYSYYKLILTAGVTYTFSAYVKGDPASGKGLGVWSYAGGGLIAASIQEINASSFTRCTVQFTPISTSEFSLHSVGANSNVFKNVEIWGAQLEAGTTASAYTPTTTRPIGDVTIPITNRLRVAQPINAAVTWNKPTFNARLLDTSGVQYRSAVTEPVSFDFGEAI